MLRSPLFSTRREIQPFTPKHADAFVALNMLILEDYDCSVCIHVFENQRKTLSDGTREIPEKRVRVNVMRRSKLRDFTKQTR